MNAYVSIAHKIFTVLMLYSVMALVALITLYMSCVSYCNVLECHDTECTDCSSDYTLCDTCNNGFDSTSGNCIGKLDSWHP